MESTGKYWVPVFNILEKHVADGKGILEAILLTAFHRNEFVAVTGQLPKNTNVLGRDKTAFHQTDTGLY